MSIRVEFVRAYSGGSAAYLFKLCEDTRPSGLVFSIYGTGADGLVTDPDAQVRQPRVTNAYSGVQFEVAFRSQDEYFVIYQDRLTGGNYSFDTTNELVRGQFTAAFSDSLAEPAAEYQGFAPDDNDRQVLYHE